MTTINLDGVVGWDIEASEFATNLDAITGDVTFELNSGGGYVTDGLSILNKIRAYDRGRTTAKVSYAASMMTQIALACDEVQVYDNAMFMIHNVQGMVIGDHNDLKEAADLQERMSNMLAQLYVKKSGKSLEEIKEMMDADTYLFGQEVVDIGFADSVIDTDKDKDKDNLTAHANTVMGQVQKAMKQEKLSLSDMKSSFKNCIGNCELVTSSEVSVPTASDSEKSVNKPKGEDMTPEQISAMEEQNKVLVLNRDTLTARIQTLETAQTALEATNAELTVNMETLVTAHEVKLSEVEKEAKTNTGVISERVDARVKEAFASNAGTEDTVLAMIAEPDDKVASKIALDSKDTQAVMQGESREEPKESAMLAYAKTNKGRLK